MSSEQRGQVADRPARMQRGRDWGVMVTATAARVGYGLLFAPFVVAALPSEAAARVFQLLFLQGGLIALLSASAYARGAHLAADGGTVWSAARSFLRFLAVGTVIAIVAGLAFLPVPEEPLPLRSAIVVLLVGGATASALVGFLQGVVVVRDGGLVAFLPSIGMSVVGVAGLVVLWRPQPSVIVVAAWVVPQILTCLTLVALPAARRIFRRTERARRDERSRFATTGIVNAASVGAAYAFRERWAAAQPVSHAELSFSVVRVTELLYQVLYMGAASVPRLIDRVVGRLLSARWGRAQLLSIGVLAAALAIGPSVARHEWSLVGFVVAELAVMPARVLTTLCWLSLLGRRTTWAYQAAIFGGTLLAFGAMAIPSIQVASYGLQAFHAVNLVTALIVVSLVSRRDTLATCGPAAVRQQ